jgi:membrane-associated phospholipid phosphatase
MSLLPRPSIWITTLGLAALNAALLPLAGFSVGGTPLLAIASLSAVLMGLAALYATRRPAPIIAASLSGTAFLVAYSAVAALFSYIITTSSLPLRDQEFAALDRALGFDFVAHIEWLVQRPFAVKLLQWIYFSASGQLIIIIIGLAIKDRPALDRFLTIYTLTSLIVLIGSALLPALGTYPFHEIGADILQPFGRYHLAHYHALRDGSFASFDLREVEGLVTFPSFHAVLAVIMTRALWRLGWLGPVGAVLNGVMLVSTLAIGGHFLTDIVAGIVIALIALWWLDRPRKTAPKPAPDRAGP